MIFITSAGAQRNCLTQVTCIQPVRLIESTTTKLTFKISKIAKHSYGISIKVRSR